MAISNEEAEIVWRPTDEQIAHANFTHFLTRVGTTDYAELTARIASDPKFSERAMLDVIQHIGLRFHAPPRAYVDLRRGKPFAKFFPGAEYNAAENCIDRWIDHGIAHEPAILAEDEAGNVRTLSFFELRSEVTKLAGVLRNLGVTRGATVGIFLPMIPEAAIALLAIGYLGAIAVPAFSGFGAHALAVRMNDAGCEVLLCVETATRRGRSTSTLPLLRDALSAMPSVGDILMLGAPGIRERCGNFGDVEVHDWHVEVARVVPQAHAMITAADDPYLLLYTSGSTGKPKGVVHPHAGFAIKTAIDQHLCFDVRMRDRMLWYTDMGWMMGPFLVLGALTLGATIVLYDGTPDYPAADRLWQLCEKHAVTHLGLAPTAIRALATHGAELPAASDLRSLRILGSTGEPWNTGPYKWFLQHVGRSKAPIINYSGGTEIGGGIVGCFPTMPLGPNAFHGPIPGMVADVVDAAGQPMRGGVGELVLREPWIGMTQSLWGGNAVRRDDARYLKTYWGRFEQTWTHGDWAQIEGFSVRDRRGLSERARFWYIRGRSDDTINVAGKRVGPAEFESALASDPLVREAAAIAVPDATKGDVVVCLVVLKNDHDANETTRKRLMDLIENQMGKALRPKAVRFVTELPKTRNLKVMRRVARAVYLGLRDLGDLSGLENTSALDAIANAR